MCNSDEKNQDDTKSNQPAPNITDDTEKPQPRESDHVFWTG